MDRASASIYTGLVRTSARDWFHGRGPGRMPLDDRAAFVMMRGNCEHGPSDDARRGGNGLAAGLRGSIQRKELVPLLLAPSRARTGIILVATASKTSCESWRTYIFRDGLNPEAESPAEGSSALSGRVEKIRSASSRHERDQLSVSEHPTCQHWGLSPPLFRQQGSRISDESAQEQTAFLVAVEKRRRRIGSAEGGSERGRREADKIKINTRFGM